MPAPDVQYFLDCSITCGQLAGDTHFYFMEMCPDANDVFDANEKNKPNQKYRYKRENYIKSLTDTCLYLENEYIKWRNHNKRDSRMASMASLEPLPHIYQEVVGSIAGFLAQNSKIEKFDSRALMHLEDKMDLPRISQIIKRSLHRAAQDFDGYDAKQFREISSLHINRLEQNRIQYDIAVREMRNGLQLQAVPWVEGEYVHARQFTNQKEVEKIIRKRQEESKKIIKRSVKFLNRLAGPETTQMFLGGNAIRIEGQHAIYELSKKSSVLDSHGGFQALSIFDKDHPDLMLCNLCIATPKVPLLDHVANLIMHIQSGEELEILRIGNARNVNDDAYEREWLTPYLPKKRNPDLTPNLAEDLGEMIGNHLRIRHGIPDNYDQRKELFMPQAKQFVLKEIFEPYIPMLRATKAHLNWDNNQNFMLLVE